VGLRHIKKRGGEDKKTPITQHATAVEETGDTGSSSCHRREVYWS
jgi:hypothetical protein